MNTIKCPRCSFSIDLPEDAGKPFYCPYCYHLLADPSQAEAPSDTGGAGKQGHIEIREGRLFFYPYGGEEVSFDLEELRKRHREQEREGE